MLKKTGMVIVGATFVVVHCLIGGAAFAQLQENGQPCPPECVTDSMEIVTWQEKGSESFIWTNSARNGAEREGKTVNENYIKVKQA